MLYGLMWNQDRHLCAVMLDDASLCDLNPVWEDKGGGAAINKNLSVPRLTRALHT